ncbi:MAG: pyridoxamine 5'-phosphate oxidase family protein [Desertimonas sp.]
MTKRISRKLALSPAELADLLGTEWNMRIATASPSGWINATPLWFVWHDERVWTFCRGRKVENLRVEPRCTVLVDRAERFPELQGVMIQGRARVLETHEAEDAEPALAEVRRLYGVKYAGGHGDGALSSGQPMAARATGASSRWVVVEPVRVVSWDNTKLPAPSSH